MITIFGILFFIILYNKMSVCTDTHLEPELQAMFSELKLIPSSEEDQQQLIKILRFLLYYPSNDLAYIHRHANRLGQYDYIASHQELRKQYIVKGENYQTCQCCYSIVQQKTLSQCTRIENVVTLGESTKLFFNDLKFGVLMLIISFVFYGIYSFATNISASNRNQISCFSNKTCKLALIGLGSKLYTEHSDLNRKFYIAQIYLGLLMIMLWAVLFILKTFKQRSITMQMDKQAATASDFTVMFVNLPSSYTKQTLQAKLDQYADNIKDLLLKPEDEQVKYDGKFTISRFNPVRAYYQTLKMAQRLPSIAQQKLAQAMEQLRLMIRQRQNVRGFTNQKQQRQQLYRRIDQLRVQITGQRVRQLKIIEETYRKMQSKNRRIVFVTFNHTYAKINLLKLNQFSALKRIKMHLFSKKSTYLIDIDEIKIQSAPEPEDVIWQNIGVSNKEVYVRRFLTFLITILVLGCSFAAIYGLSKAQINNNRITISLLLSLVINIVNVLLNCFIQSLTVQEKDYTTSKYQISVGFKIVLAQLMNSIVIQMIAAKYIKDNIYQQGGLVDDVFYFALLNTFLPPLIRIINPYYYFLKVVKSYYSRPHKKLYCQSQAQFNKIWEAAEFQIGLQYAYLFKTIIYTAFFMSLQPIIIFFGIVGLALMYQAQKFVLFKQSIRPKPSSNIITQSLNSLFYFSIIAYGLGSLTWTNFLPQQSAPRYTLAPNIIAICIGVIVYFVTFGDIADSLVKQKYTALSYEQERLFLPTQYDRFNPITKSEGLKSFIKYLQNKKKQHKLQDGDDNDLKLSLDYISKILIKSKHQSKFQNVPTSSDAILSEILEDQKVQPLPIKHFSRVRSLINKRTESEVKAAFNRIQELHLDQNAGTQNRLSIPDQDVHINPQKLKNVITINALQQKPSMISSKFNPIDFVEAVREKHFQQESRL